MTKTTVVEQPQQVTAVEPPTLPPKRRSAIDLDFSDVKESLECRDVTEKRSIWPVGVDEYKYSKRVGVGASGCVKLVKNSTGQHFVVKVVKPTKSLSMNMVTTRATNEVACMTACQGHPNIIKIHDYMKSDRKLFMVLELAEYGDLFDHTLTYGRMSMTQSVNLFAQLMSGVAHMHSCGVGHRDIKPENLLLSGTKQQKVLKICDFGFATKWNQGDALVEGTMGTVRCLAPELIRRESNPDPHHSPFAVDIWACGVVLFYMLTGTFPFQGSSDVETMKNITKLKIAQRYTSVLPAECQDLFRQIFVKDPTKRPTARQILAHPFISKNRNAKI